MVVLEKLCYILMIAEEKMSKDCPVHGRVHGRVHGQLYKKREFFKNY